MWNSFCSLGIQRYTWNSFRLMRFCCPFVTAPCCTLQLPDWWPVTIVKGGRPANLLVSTMDSEWGKKLFGKALIRSISQPIWKVCCPVSMLQHAWLIRHKLPYAISHCVYASCIISGVICSYNRLVVPAAAGMIVNLLCACLIVVLRQCYVRIPANRVGVCPHPIGN